MPVEEVEVGQANVLSTPNEPTVRPEKKSKGKGKGKKPEITPEYIAQQRALREAQKIAKREALIAQGIDPDQVDTPADLRFISRPILRLPVDAVGDEKKGIDVSIMTYNVLAQALIRRKLFPTSGNAVKWFKRSVVLLSEFKHYNSDILLLQEVDHVQFHSFWKTEFAKLGYEAQYHRWGDKNHGVAIFFKADKFEMADRMLIDYDKESTGDIVPRTVTKNVGLMLALKFKDALTKEFPDSPKRGILIGTTHLFWHPFGTYERTRQTYLILKKCQEFQSRVSTLQGGEWFQFFGGDFNSQPFDAPYLSMTSKPIKYDERCKRVIECSTSFTFSKLREGIEDEDEEGGNVEKFGENQPKHPVPEEFVPTEDQTAMVLQIQQLHNSLPLRAISLYSVGYRHVHPENSGLDNDVFEPEISNWAHAWRGLLDYICFITSWDLKSDTSLLAESGSVEQFEQETGVQLKGFLRMPPAAEMTTHGQPHEGEYPSDHLCMIAEVKLIM